MGFLAENSEHQHKSSFEGALKRASSHKNLLRTLILVGIALVAFSTRLFSVLRFESVIHEFDPWFNFRATKYLVANGWYPFLNWFDERVWHPLGRVVGVTVYPGLMITSALLHKASDALKLGIDIREICVFLAPVFSGLTALATYLLTAELQDGSAALFAAAFVAIVPGYISRSVAGSYDNEAISITLMMATFYCWIKAVKKGSAIWAVATAMLYFYMAASWGGYVFITNLIPLHSFALLALGRYSTRLYTAFTTYYILGMLATMTIPFIGLIPTRSSEHMAGMGVFCLMQLFALADVVKGLVDDERHFKKIARVMIFGVFCALMGLLAILTASGRVAPWAGRFYSLWDTSYARKHIPIIASVSEHQPTPWTSFFFDMNALLFLAPVGIFYCYTQLQDEHIFAIVYAVTASYFAGVMVRLMLTLAPIMCVLGGMGASKLYEAYLPNATSKGIGKIKQSLAWDTRLAVLIPMTAYLVYFVWHCTWVTSSAYSSPSIVLSSTDPRTGKMRIIDDFREAYYWLRRNTPTDSKVLAWWDYGYQISGMADRPTIVDNNTWNNTHIATVGRIFASTEEKALPLLRQLDVDYILVLSGVISGYSGDDMNKFLWMIRIAEAEFPSEVKEKDFLTHNGEYRVDSGATQTLKDSLLYKMTYSGVSGILGPQATDRARRVPIPGVDPKLKILDEAYCTDNHIIRIFKVKRPDSLGRPLM